MLSRFLILFFYYISYCQVRFLLTNVITTESRRQLKSSELCEITRHGTVFTYKSFSPSQKEKKRKACLGEVPDCVIPQDRCSGRKDM